MSFSEKRIPSHSRVLVVTEFVISGIQCNQDADPPPLDADPPLDAVLLGCRTPPGCRPPLRDIWIQLDAVDKRAVRILLECILVKLVIFSRCVTDLQAVQSLTARHV